MLFLVPAALGKPESKPVEPAPLLPGDSRALMRLRAMDRSVCAPTAINIFLVRIIASLQEKVPHETERVNE